MTLTTGRSINIEQSTFIAARDRVRAFPNVFALAGIFLLSDGRATETKPDQVTNEVMTGKAMSCSPASPSSLLVAGGLR